MTVAVLKARPGKGMEQFPLVLLLMASSHTQWNTFPEVIFVAMHMVATLDFLTIFAVFP